MAFDYANAAFPIRSDIPAAHQALWRKLAAPGSWWTGEQRIAIALASREAIDCRFCLARKQALSPYQFAGEHEGHASLPELALDAVHRIVTDQQRITANWVESNEANGLGKPAYVELVGIVVCVLSIDEFHRSLDLPLEPLPEPVEGEPDGYLPTHICDDTGYVPMITRDGNQGAEADLWAEGGGANVIRALSLVPDALRDWRRLGDAQYLSFEGMANFVRDENRAIDRMQMELVAGRVSSVNECFY